MRYKCEDIKIDWKLIIKKGKIRKHFFSGITVEKAMSKCKCNQRMYVLTCIYVQMVFGHKANNAHII